MIEFLNRKQALALPGTQEALRIMFPCRVYWGSHGCHKIRNHKGRHACDPCRCKPFHCRLWSLRWFGCVERYPYYGRKTTFYGEDS